MAILSVGKDILSYCSKCKLSLGHIIVSMLDPKTVAKVKCNTCQGIHRYKDPSIGGKPLASTKRVSRGINTAGKVTSKAKENKYASTEELWTEQYAKSSSQTHPYSIRHKFIKGDTVDHKIFGIGFVQEVLDDKIEVLFKNDIKTLVHAKP